MEGKSPCFLYYPTSTLLFCVFGLVLFEWKAIGRMHAALAMVPLGTYLSFLSLSLPLSLFVEESTYSPCSLSALGTGALGPQRHQRSPHALPRAPSLPRNAIRLKEADGGKKMYLAF